MILRDCFTGRLALVALALLLFTAPAALAGPADCGDGDIDPGETCERPGDIVGPADQACRDDCTYCGDGVVQASEECDDGNGRDTDGCRNSCVLPVCGDGLNSNTGGGETCDPPGQPAGGNGNDCRGDCTVCGDGAVNGGEDCDDANGNDTDSCRNNCTGRSCGDGVVDTDLGEACDDGNTMDADDCRNNCTIPVCGDGILDGQNGETCERPGDIVGPVNDTCRDDCTFCGDNVVQSGEDCDDANARDTDSCPNSCSFVVAVPCELRVVKTCSVPAGDDDDDDDPMDGDDDDDDDDVPPMGDGDDDDDDDVPPMGDGDDDDDDVPPLGDGDDDDDDDGDRDGYHSVDNDDCAGNIVSMHLRYTGDGCDATTNDQLGLAGCWGDASGADPVALQVANDSGDSVYADQQQVFMGDVIEVRALNAGQAVLPSQTTVWVDNGMENVTLDTSCGSPISVGDHFGSLELVRLTTTEGGTVTLPDASAPIQTSECVIDGPAEVVYTYEITNDSSVAVEGLTVFDSELGAAPGSPFARLESGATLVLHASAMISETTINTVSVSGVLETGDVCPVFEDTATVIVPVD